MANEFGDFASLVPSKGVSESSQDFGDFASLVPETRGLSPVSETGGGAALMYPTAKRKQLAEGEGTTPTKVAEAVFGKGSAQDAPLEERIKKIGETTAVTGLGAMGLKALAPSMISGGEAMMANPAVPRPLRLAGGVVAAGGALAERLGPREISAVAGTAGTTQSAEEILNMAGVPREFQVLGSMGAGGLAQLAMEYPEMVANYLVKGVRGTVPSLLRQLGIEMKTTAEESASKLRTQGNQKAKDEILAGDTKGASTTIDTALKGGIAERQKAIEADRILAESAAQSEILKRQKLLQQQQSLATKPITQAPDEETFAGQLQGDIYSTQKPLLDARSKAYSENYNAGIKSAEQKESEGNFWQGTEGGQSIKSYWENKITNRKLGPDSEKAVQKVLDDVYGKTGDNPRSITGVDEIIRMLGDKASRESAGYGAIGDKLAGDLRRSITEGSIKDIGDKEAQKIGTGLYDWSPKFGQAKKEYASITKDLEAWESKTGSKVLGEETKPLEVPKQYFSSRAGYDDLVKQLGGDKAKAAEYGKQYAQLKTQDLTTSKELNNWLKDPKNGWIDNVPGLRQQVEKKAIAAEQATKLSEQIPVLEKNLIQWNKSVDAKVKSLYSDVMGNEKPGFAIKEMMTGKTLSESEKRALITYVGANPEARKLIPSVVRDILTDQQQSPKTVVKLFDERISPMLEQAKLANKEEIANLRQQAVKLYETDAKDYSMPKNKKTLKAINFLYGAIASRAGSAVTPNAQEQQ